MHSIQKRKVKRAFRLMRFIPHSNLLVMLPTEGLDAQPYFWLTIDEKNSHQTQIHYRQMIS